MRQGFTPDLLLTIGALLFLAVVASRTAAGAPARRGDDLSAATGFFAPRDRFTRRGWIWALVSRLLVVMATLLVLVTAIR